MILTTIPLWLLAHFLGDFAFGQNNWLKGNKGDLWLAMVGHAAIYAAAFAVIGLTGDWLILTVLFLTHFAIDTVKARWRWTRRFFHWALSWNIAEVREYLARSTKPFHEADASTAVIKTRVVRLDGYAMYADQAAHLAVLIGLWATRGQAWL